jgi:hypothetical protein
MCVSKNRGKLTHEHSRRIGIYKWRISSLLSLKACALAPFFGLEFQDSYKTLSVYRIYRPRVWNARREKLRNAIVIQFGADSFVCNFLFHRKKGKIVIVFFSELRPTK